MQSSNIRVSSDITQNVEPPRKTQAAEALDTRRSEVVKVFALARSEHFGASQKLSNHFVYFFRATGWKGKSEKKKQAWPQNFVGKGWNKSKTNSA